MQAIAQRSRAYIAEPHKLRPDFTHQVCCLEESVRGQCRWGTSAERSGEDRDDLHPEAELRGPTFTQALLRFLSFRIRDSRFAPGPSQDPGRLQLCRSHRAWSAALTAKCRRHCPPSAAGTRPSLASRSACKAEAELAAGGYCTALNSMCHQRQRHKENFVSNRSVRMPGCSW